jgi:hypothetical protein|tara:strand:+ start:136 stop:318 length:183 start_codon:yes stop_codon:yes gene_type:complete
MDDDNLHEQLKLAFSIYIKESEKFESGVKASAVRAREALHELKEIIVLRRKEIQDKKKEM